MMGKREGKPSRKQKGDEILRILIVEDEKRLAETLVQIMTEHKYTADAVFDGESGFDYAMSGIYDVIVLDVMLPKRDGFSVVREMRRQRNATPVLMLTARDEISDKVTGLDCGADDYIVKPFAFQELMARIRSIRRRPQTWSSSRIFSLGDITYDPEQNKLSSDSGECSLSKREGDLLELFLRNPGQTLPRNTLLMRVWGPDTDVEEGNLDNYVHFLRRRLKTVKSQLQITTVRGVGYCLQVFQ